MFNAGKREFRWESGYEKTWTAIREDEAGRLVTSLDHLIHDAHMKQRKKRQRLAAGTEGFVRLGMMRHLFLVIDLSQAMQAQDLKPNRLACTLRVAIAFVRDYFDQNPISQLGIIITMDRRAERLTELSGNPRCHITALESLYARPCLGEPSLQNALLLAESRLKHMPHNSEIIILMASLTTCDPGDIHQTIQSLASNRIRCFVISLAVEVFVYRALAQLTQGSFHVILDELHLKSVMKEFVPPPVANIEADATLIRMGEFNGGVHHSNMSHLGTQSTNPTDPSHTTSTGTNPHYVCPRCRSAYCELPVECRVCGLTLVAAPHLARAYHHLFPLDMFETVEPIGEKESAAIAVTPAGDSPRSCTGCNVQLPIHLPAYKCTKCQAIFCNNCDAFLHDSVHSCPACVLHSTL